MVTYLHETRPSHEFVCAKNPNNIYNLFAHSEYGTTNSPSSKKSNMLKFFENVLVFKS